MRKRRGIFSQLVHGLVTFLFACLMVLFGWPWLLFGSSRKIEPMPPIHPQRRVWTQHERDEWARQNRGKSAA